MSYLDITLPGTDGKMHALKEYRGQKVILYFYPKDNTSGCTIEAKDFTRLKSEYASKGYIIIGVSKDSIKSHQNFIESQELDLLLLSDENEELIRAFDVLKEKSMYGRSYLGIERSTFVIDEFGSIVQELRKVSASNHADDLLCNL